jgi:hypothetical protein
MRRAVISLFATVAALSASAVAKNCTQIEEYQAVGVIPYLDTWPNVNLAYRQFGHCDDGAIAEGMSEMVVRLLVDHWSRLPELRKLTQADSTFETFVLKKINATLDAKDLDKLHDLAKLKCPRGSSQLCRKIVERTEATWKDQ